jgi:hypothetical protein
VRDVVCWESRGALVPIVVGITAAEVRRMARKPNYDFEKRRKEQERKAKKDAKAQRKRDARDSELAGEGSQDAGMDVTVVPGADEETTAPEQQVE